MQTAPVIHMGILRLVDGMNVARRRFETVGTSEAVRGLLYEFTYANDATIWCWDPPGGLKARRAIYPAYKANRPPLVSSFASEMVPWLKSLLAATGATQVEIAGFEADDIIASLATASGVPVHIHSNDRDFCQLLTNKHVTLDTAPKPGVDPQYVRLYKTLVGDPSDNVKGLPGFGEKSWERIPNLAELQKLILHRVAGYAFTGPQIAQLTAMGIPKRSITALIEEPEELKALWAVVGFIPIPPNLIFQNTKVGTPNPMFVSSELRKFML